VLPSAAAWIAIGALPAAMLELGLEDVEGVADSSSVQALRCKRDLGTAVQLVQMAPKYLQIHCKTILPPACGISNTRYNSQPIELGQRLLDGRVIS
jgi:hypothetical protein